ncbi:MAG: nucleoside deaminase [Ignavibacteriae bacterium]|nr:nucleoside deaminase [Ignavibacteriota bacterium]NOG98208.1 nucleoside deaminase [Ignavibacteriota bacterium]
MLFPESVYRFMFAALSEAEIAFEKDEVPIGAVVVHNNRIIGKGHNQVETLNDPTAHAEMIAITAASNNLSSKYLTDCELYVTLEPCVMCTGAVILAKLPKLYFGAFEPKSGACGSIYNFAEDKKLNHTIKIYSGIYAEESKNLLQSFFDKKRKIN